MVNLEVHILLIASKKTGRISFTATAIGKAQLQLYALQHTTPTKVSYIFERSTGNLVFEATGTNEGFPKIRKSKIDGDLGVCDDYGIGLSDLQLIKDDRFDS